MADAALAASWCGPEKQASSPRQVLALTVGGDEVVLCLTSRGRRGAGPALVLLARRGFKLEEPSPLPLPEELPSLGQVWPLPGPAGASFLAAGPDALFRVTLARSSTEFTASAERIVGLPSGTSEVAVFAEGNDLTVAAIDDRCEPVSPDAPRVEPPPPRPLDLTFWSSASSADGWRDVCRLPREAGGLAVSSTAAVWSQDNNYIFEESSAGAFYGALLAPGAAAECLTPADESLPALQSGALPAGAGKVRGAAFGPDGTLVLHANFSVTHPVTAACGLWRLDWPTTAAGGGWAAPSRERLTAEGLEVSSFGWADGSGPALWATAIEGVSRRSFVVGGADIGAGICTNVAYSASGAAVFGRTEMMSGLHSSQDGSGIVADRCGWAG